MHVSLIYLSDCSLPPRPAGFGNLVLNDQMNLLQSSWVEVLTLCFAYRSLSESGGAAGDSSPPPRAQLTFARELTIEEKVARDCGLEQVFFQVGCRKEG